jgi:hypothetical protein
MVRTHKATIAAETILGSLMAFSFETRVCSPDVGEETGRGPRASPVSVETVLVREET